MKRKKKKEMSDLSNRQRRIKTRNHFCDHEIRYKYINTMGGYIIYFNDHNWDDTYIARRLKIPCNEYLELIKRFRCTEYRGISYFDSIDQIEAMLVMIKLSR